MKTGKFHTLKNKIYKNFLAVIELEAILIDLKLSLLTFLFEILKKFMNLNIFKFESDLFRDFRSTCLESRMFKEGF